MAGWVHIDGSPNKMPALASTGAVDTKTTAKTSIIGRAPLAPSFGESFHASKSCLLPAIFMMTCSEGHDFSAFQISGAEPLDNTCKKELLDPTETSPSNIKARELERPERMQSIAQKAPKTRQAINISAHRTTSTSYQGSKLALGYFLALSWVRWPVYRFLSKLDRGMG